MRITAPSAGAGVPPHAKRGDVCHTLHGQTRPDPYAWLRDKHDPAVIAHLEAENAYTDALTAPAAALRDALYADMLAHIKQTDATVPYRRGGFWYWSRTRAGQQYPVLCRTRADGEPPDPLAEDPAAIVLDLNELAAGQPFLGLGDFTVSDDGTLLAYSLDTTGYREYVLHVMDLRERRTVGVAIPLVSSVVWAADNRTLVYTTQDAVTHRSDRVWRRAIDADTAQPVYAETDEIYDVAVDRSRDGSTIAVISVAKDTTEYRLLDAAAPAERPVLFRERCDGIRYTLEAGGDTIYVRTNEGAPDFCVYAVPRNATARAGWRCVVPERPGTTIVGIDVFARVVAVSGRRDGRSSIELLDRASLTMTALTFDADDYDVEASDNPEYDAPALRFTYESLVTPRSVFEHDVVTGERTLLRRLEVPGYDEAQYVAERRMVVARDGTPVPVSIVARHDVARDGSAPLLLYGYGSYGISIDPNFSPARLALLDRGVVYAIAHIRGGGEYGEAWRLAGNLRNKMTTFTDFIDCADELVRAGFTSHDRLAIMGGSAGGLLVGAVVNERPDLCAAAIAAVPFVDVLTTMLDPTLPLTTGEYREWGNPADPDDYAYMRRYSPVDNVRTADYPAMLIEVSLNDSQVPYWEGAKFALTLRDGTTGSAPILLRANLAAGHGGSSGRYDRLREIAFEYAFILQSTAGLGP